MRRLPYWIAIVSVAAVVLVAWLNRGRFLPVNVGSAAPAFTAYDLSGERVTLEDFAGEVVLLNIWATWCPPCVEEMPALQRLQEEIDADDFRVVAVSVDAPQGERDALGRPGGDVESFADSLDLSFTVLHDPSGRIQDTYSTTGVPESFLIGRDGKIYKKVIGAAEWNTPQYREVVRRLLDG